MGKIKIGISSCLLGNEVRYDGAHKYDAYINEILGRYFEFIPYCPEVGIGLGVPRPPIHLVQLNDAVHVRGVYDRNLDFTAELENYARETAAGFENICGYIFKTRSPSCGVEGTGIFNDMDECIAEGSGLYAQEIMNACPELPVIDEERLLNPRNRENFLERVFVLQRWHKLEIQGFTENNLRDFHHRHQLVLQAHDESACEELLGLLNNKVNQDIASVAHTYLLKLMDVLKTMATCESHAGVLRSIYEMIKAQLDTVEQRELVQMIDDYQQGLLPRTLTVSLLRQYLPFHESESILKQYYFNSGFLETMSGSANVCQ